MKKMKKNEDFLNKKLFFLNLEFVLQFTNRQYFCMFRIYSVVREFRTIFLQNLTWLDLFLKYQMQFSGQKETEITSG